MNPKAKGEIAEAQILAALLLAGETVLLPHGDNQRYDLVLDRDGEFVRVQCKTGKTDGERITFNSASSVTATRRKWKDYRGQADLFAIYCFELDKIYIIPVDEVGLNGVTLRLLPAKNGQETGIRYAKDYELATGLRRLRGRSDKAL